MSAAQKLAEMRNVKSDENAKKAETEYAAGKKHVSTGFLGLSKPDWERGARSFQEAAKLFALSGPKYSKSLIDACIQCANAYEKQDQYHPAAQHYEKAAAETAKTPEDAKAAANLYRTAGRMYRLGESPDKAATIYMKAAACVGDVDVKLATEIVGDACAVFEDEQRGMFANDTFKQAINYLVKKQLYTEAIALLHRQNKVYLQHIKTFESDLYKNCLSIVLLRFQMTDYETAEKEYKELCSLVEFNTSAEGIAADGLLDAWNQGSPESLEKTLKLQTFTFLANSIAVLTRKLVFDPKKLAAANATRVALLPKTVVVDPNATTQASAAAAGTTAAAPAPAASAGSTGGSAATPKPADDEPDMT